MQIPILKGGLMAHIDITTFKPKKPAEMGLDYKALDGFEKLLKVLHGQAAAEKKYDGYGILLDTVTGRMCSLDNSMWNPAALPELQKDLGRLRGIVAIGELVGRPTKKSWTKTDEFNAIKRRAATLRAGTPDPAAVARLSQEFPLDIRLYHLLEAGGKSLLALPGSENRTALEDILRRAKAEHVLATERRVISDPRELWKATLAAFDSGQEGFVVKDLTTPYVPGTRTKDWAKLKDKVAVDLIVLGLYQTEERLKAGWPCANMLCGVLNERTGKFETLAKITITSHAMADQVFERLKPALAFTWSKAKPHFWENDHRTPVQSDPSVAYNPELPSSKSQMKKVPFVFVMNPMRNSFIIEAKALEVSTGEETWHSCGLADGGRAYTLRQGVYERTRDDKTTCQVTTTKQVLDYVAGV
jgi:ATP-dependent DNA ligase